MKCARLFTTNIYSRESVTIARLLRRLALPFSHSPRVLRRAHDITLQLSAPPAAPPLSPARQELFRRESAVVSQGGRNRRGRGDRRREGRPRRRIRAGGRRRRGRRSQGGRCRYGRGRQGVGVSWRACGGGSAWARLRYLCGDWTTGRPYSISGEAEWGHTGRRGHTYVH